MELVSSAENSTLDWRREYGYIEDIGDGRGYTGGPDRILLGDRRHARAGPRVRRRRAGRSARPFVPALGGSTAPPRIAGSAGHSSPPGGGRPGTRCSAGCRCGADRMYFDPAVRRAKADGLGTLGQFIYYDAIVMHGPGPEPRQLRRDPRRGRSHSPRPRPRAAPGRLPQRLPRRAPAAMKTEAKHATRRGSTTSSASSCANATSPCGRRWSGTPTATAGRSRRCREVQTTKSMGTLNK